MTTVTIKKGKNIEIRAVISKYAPDLYSVEIKQLFPEAQRPHWRRLAQLNLSGVEVLDFAHGLIKEVRDGND